MSRTTDLALQHFDVVRFARFRFLTKPIVNGPLGERGLLLARAKERDFAPGCPLYLVVDSVSLGPVGAGHTWAEALEWARDAMARDTFAEYIAEYRRLHDYDHAIWEKWRRRSLEPGLPVDEPALPRTPRSKPVPKRRIEIFDKSEGKCHYCATPLTLDGKWHIEHMQPRALLGPNDKSNLVAACVPCNMKKRDRTAEEFIASRSA